MKTATELSTFLENKPGALAAILADFKKHHVNLEAITVVDHTDHALVRMIVGDAKRALSLLEAAGLLVIEATLLRIEASNRPGALGEVCARLAARQDQHPVSVRQRRHQHASRSLPARLRLGAR